MLGLVPEHDGSVLVFRPTGVSRDGYVVFEAAARPVEGGVRVFRFEVLHDPETDAWQFFDDLAVVTSGTEVAADDPFIQKRPCSRSSRHDLGG